MDRRAAFGQIATGAAVVAGLPQLALADGAVSGATKERAKAVYGNRIAQLKAAVDKGDFGAVADEKNAFVLYNSGAYPMAKDKSKKSEAINETNAIFAAIKNKDSAALKAAYKQYVASNDIKEFPKVDPQKGQGYSTDYDYRVRTPSA